MLEIFEYITAKKSIDYIWGLYSPGNEYAKQFYAKNKYKVKKHGMETMLMKTIDVEAVLNEHKYKIIDMSDIANI